MTTPMFGIIKKFAALLALLACAALPSVALADDWGGVNWGDSGTQPLGGTYSANDPLNPTNVGGLLSNSGYSSGYLNLGPGSDLGGSLGVSPGNLGGFGGFNLGTIVSNSSYTQSLGLGQSSLNQSSLGVGGIGLGGSALTVFPPIGVNSGNPGNSIQRGSAGSVTQISTANTQFSNTNTQSTINSIAVSGNDQGQPDGRVLHDLGGGASATETCSGGMCRIVVRDNQGNITSQSTAPVGATLTVNGVTIELGSGQSSKPATVGVSNNTAQGSGQSDRVARDFDLPDGTTLITVCGSTCTVAQIGQDGATVLASSRGVKPGTAIAAGGTTVIVGQGGSPDLSDSELDIAHQLAADTALAAQSNTGAFSLQNPSTNLYPQSSNTSGTASRQTRSVDEAWRNWQLNRDENDLGLTPPNPDGSYTPLFPDPLRDPVPSNCDAGTCRVSQRGTAAQFASNTTGGTASDAVPVGISSGGIPGVAFDPFNPTPVRQQGNLVGGNTDEPPATYHPFDPQTGLQIPGVFSGKAVPTVSEGQSTDNFVAGPLVSKGQTVTVLNTVNQSGTVVVSNKSMAPSPPDFYPLLVGVGGRSFPLRNISGGSNPSSLDILRTQWVLIKTGNLDESDAGGRMDTFTINAIKRFQASQNLPVTGTLDTATVARINQRMDDIADVVRPKVFVSPDTSALPPKDQSRPPVGGNNGEGVRRQQSALPPGAQVVEHQLSPTGQSSALLNLTNITATGAAGSGGTTGTGVAGIVGPAGALNQLNTAVQGGALDGLRALGSTMNDLGSAAAQALSSPTGQSSALLNLTNITATGAAGSGGTQFLNPLNGIPSLNFVAPQGNVFTSPGYTPGAGNAFGAVPNALYQVPTFTSAGQPSAVSSPVNNALLTPSIQTVLDVTRY